ncbi:MAG: ThiF family adenylyltransferase [Niabella sp.]
MPLQPQVSDHTNIYQPEFYRLSHANEEALFSGLLKGNPSIQIYDRIESQLTELIRINHPERRFSKEELAALQQQYIIDGSYDKFGVWVHYPWSQKVVHLLDEEDFIKVRTNRNQYKITPEELQLLRSKKIGIIGLSVGQSIALTIATERICGALHLADFDNIELSNLNRLSNANVFELGALKVIVTARKIAELDPFLKVTCWTEGLTESNIDGFLGEGSSKLDILVEECDSIDIKILSRVKAREKKIPVVMDTNDKGMLDIERFDLEPKRPVLHGRIKELETMETTTLLQKLKGLTIEEKVGYVAQMIGMENISEEMKRSLPEMNKTIIGWPQLSSAVTLGAAMVTDICRRIALEKSNVSGRYFIDFNELVN